MSVEGKKKIAAKAAELKEAIKEELQTEKQEAMQYMHELKDAAHDAVEDTKEKLHEMVETAKKNMHEKTDKLVQYKDEVVTDTAETLVKVIDHAKCTLASSKCDGHKATTAGEAEQETDSDSNKVYPV